MRRHMELNERGIALPMALFALVVIGTLVAGVFFTARLEMKGGESAMNATRASEAAQGGLQMGIPNVLTLGNNLVDGQSTTGTRTQIGTSGSYYQLTVTRLNRYMYLLKSVGEYEGRAGVVLSRRQMAQLVKRYMPEVNIQAGATVVGTPVVKGSAVIDGNDHIPTGWTGCDAAGPAVPGIRTNSSDTTNIQKASNIVTGSGTPDIVGNDTSVSNMKNVLDTLFYQLAGQANVIIHATDGSTISGNVNVSGSTCVKTDTLNWGDPGRASPAGPCESYFPIVYVDIPLGAGGTHGAVKLHAYGQGVLLINGDMELNANSNWTGLILLRGEFGKANGDATITGGVVAQNADLDVNGSGVQGNLALNYSSCAVKTALNNLSVTAPTQYRGFMQF